MTTAEEALQRSNCFKLLAACFYEPDKQLLKEERVCDNLAHVLRLLSPAAVTSAKAMGAGLDRASQEELSVDYAALFVGPFELIAAPYGSVHLEKNRRIMGDSTLETLRHYQEAGLSVDMKEPPDHIAIELEFMYYLCAKEAAALSEGTGLEAAQWRDQQNIFFHGAMRWISGFCKLIHSGAATEYYRALANCLGSYYDFCHEVYGGGPENGGAVEHRP